MSKSETPRSEPRKSDEEVIDKDKAKWEPSSEEIETWKKGREKFEVFWRNLDKDLQEEFEVESYGLFFLFLGEKPAVGFGPLRKKEHLNRLGEALKPYGFEVTYTLAINREKVQEVVNKHKQEFEHLSSKLDVHEIIEKIKDLDIWQQLYVIGLFLGYPEYSVREHAREAHYDDLERWGEPLPEEPPPVRSGGRDWVVYKGGEEESEKAERRWCTAIDSSGIFNNTDLEFDWLPDFDIRKGHSYLSNLQKDLSELN